MVPSARHCLHSRIVACVRMVSWSVMFAKLIWQVQTQFCGCAIRWRMQDAVLHLPSKLDDLVHTSAGALALRCASVTQGDRVTSRPAPRLSPRDRPNHRDLFGRYKMA